jgi:hypothetical protein
VDDTVLVQALRQMASQLAKGHKLPAHDGPILQAAADLLATLRPLQQRVEALEAALDTQQVA